MSAIVTAKCPACRGSSFTLYEQLEVDHVFRVEKGVALPMQASADMPTQTGFSATCDCGHKWTPRYATAIAIMDAEEVARLAIPAGRADLRDGGGHAER